MKTLREEIESGSKLALIKIDIIRRYIINGANTLADLGRDMNLSIPTVTKLVGELIDSGIVVGFGKQETSGGRRPIRYGVNPDSGYFVGVDIKDYCVNLALINFNGDVVTSSMKVPYRQKNTQESLDELCTIINEFINSLDVDKNNILNIGINISGRVNTTTGHSYSRYFFDEKPLNEIFHHKLGYLVSIDNDSRSMAYGEYISGVVEGEKHVLFVNVSWGLGLGIIADGKLYLGKSGFSGEFGHMSVFDNEIMCHCGKKGCLETQASGSYIYRRVIEKIGEGNSSVLQKKLNTPEGIRLDDIIEASILGDMLAIELVEEVGNTLGKYISGLINLFNPELVIIGGTVALAGDHLMLPIRSAIRKYALNMVSKDTEVKQSTLGEMAGVVGACMLARSKVLGLM